MSYSFLAKKGPLFAFLGAVILIVIAVIPIINGMSALETVPQAQQAYSEEGNIFLTALFITAALFVLAVAAAILLSLFQVVVHPKAAIKGLISFAILLVLFFVFYAMADAKGTGSLADTIERFHISDTVSRVIGAAIRLTLLLGIGSIILMIILEIWNYFKTS